ncbi:hypothetical protein E2C01_013925 [Portunus trituberculatus]|uniref:Uncharacterized protein n=1 Tax=Portunus trituberculatus TaxID=210409 RepID=A0A5B7DIS7_PORTR|nr:hypothetical protein [Portunus trituberculatus]
MNHLITFYYMTPHHPQDYLSCLDAKVILCGGLDCGKVPDHYERSRLHQYCPSTLFCFLLRTSARHGGTWSFFRKMVHPQPPFHLPVN